MLNIYGLTNTMNTGKGPTINDLGGGGGKIENELIFSAGISKIISSGRPFGIYFFLEKSLRNFFFSIQSRYFV